MTRRERLRAREHRQRAKEWAERAERQADADGDSSDAEIAIPSEHEFRRLSDRLADDEPLPKVVLYARVSTRRQDVTSQTRGALEHVRGLGVEVARTFAMKGGEPGKGVDPAQRPALFAALRYCRKHGLPLVAACFSRFLRNEHFDKKRFTGDPKARPTVAEMDAFLAATKGVELLTLADPDNTTDQDETFLQQLKATVTGRRERGGRPRNPDRAPGCRERRRARLRPLVQELAETGLGSRLIQQEVYEQTRETLARPTIDRWLRPEGVSKR